MEGKKAFIVNFFYYGLLLAIAFVVIKYIMPWLAPFVLAFIVASILNKPINFIAKSFRVKRKISAIFCVAIFYGLTLLLIFIASFNLVMYLKNVFFELPAIYAKELEPSVISIMDMIQNALTRFDPSLDTVVESFTSQISSNLGKSISTISVTVLTKLSGVISKVPSYFIGTLITVISTFFISGDYHEISDYILNHIGKKQKQIILDIKNYGGKTLFKCLKSYIFIMSITFTELSVVFLLLGVNNAVIIAFFISVFDILPVLGVGGVLVPWVILSFIQGKYAFGAGLLIGYLIITVVRNILEPKIIGGQVGLHPIATLLAMFIGTKLFGIVGLFLLPISLVIFKKLSDSGKIKLFNQGEL